MEEEYDYNLYYKTLPRRRKKQHSLDDSQSSHEVGPNVYMLRVSLTSFRDVLKRGVSSLAEG